MAAARCAQGPTLCEALKRKGQRRGFRLQRAVRRADTTWARAGERAWSARGLQVVPHPAKRCFATREARSDADAWRRRVQLGGAARCRRDGRVARRVARPQCRSAAGRLAGRLARAPLTRACSLCAPPPAQRRRKTAPPRWERCRRRCRTSSGASPSPAHRRPSSQVRCVLRLHPHPGPLHVASLPRWRAPSRSDTRCCAARHPEPRSAARCSARRLAAHRARRIARLTRGVASRSAASKEDEAKALMNQARLATPLPRLFARCAPRFAR